jgi:hypothetical protein
MPNSLSTSAAASAPYIHVTGSGMWTPQQLEQHFLALDRGLKAMRTRTGFARVLVELGEAKVQTAETAQIMQNWTARIYRETDQVAVICGTKLLAMQIRHQAKIRNLKTFADREAAVAWLLADQVSNAPLRNGQNG